MIKNTFKKIAVAFTLPVLAIGSVVEAAEVELQHAFSVSMSRFGQSWKNNSFSVVVDNIASEKEVYIHHERQDGTWTDIPMHYAGPAGEGKELWKVSDTLTVWDDEFAVKMVVNGSEFWDNNFGNNYKRLSQGYIIGKSESVVVSGFGVSPQGDTGVSRVFTSIVVDNLGPAKDVELVYTTDGWNTQVVRPATYAGPRPLIGFGSYPNPSENNAELWTAFFEIPEGTQAQFYVKYSVNGVDYFASNDGENFVVNPTMSHDSMFLRTAPSWSSGRPMTAISDHLWAADIQVSQPFGITHFKFDVFNDWSINFGDTNLDGVAEMSGGDIPAPLAHGSYRVFFNDQTLEYFLQAWGVQE